MRSIIVIQHNLNLINTIHSNNLYQIFAYVKTKEYTFKAEKHRIAGMLLYAKTNEEIQPDQMYQMHSNQI